MDAPFNSVLGDAANALIERFAPGAPDDVKATARDRVVSYLYDRPTMAKKVLFKLSGAKGILAPWRVLGVTIVGDNANGDA